jgi:hypothetical protein
VETQRNVSEHDAKEGARPAGRAPRWDRLDQIRRRRRIKPNPASALPKSARVPGSGTTGGPNVQPGVPRMQVTLPSPAAVPYKNVTLVIESSVNAPVKLIVNVAEFSM